MGFKGDINLKNPEVQFGVLEDYGLDPYLSAPPTEPYMIYFGRLVCINYTFNYNFNYIVLTR